MTAQVVEIERSRDVTMSARTRAMIEAPILAMLLQLAAPNLLFIVSQAVVSIGETVLRTEDVLADHDPVEDVLILHRQHVADLPDLHLI